jgi:putative spermidine/putrescine transport system substrate-binding protein
MMPTKATRRAVLGGMATLAAISGRARGAALKLPPAPIAFSVLDVGGALQLCRPAIDQYSRQHPEIVSNVVYSQAPATEIAGKLKAQQGAGRIDINIVLAGTDALADGVAEKLWEPLLPAYQDSLPNLRQDAFLEAAWGMQALAQGEGVCFSYSPAGPLLEYMPTAVPTPPRTVQELLDWAKQHPGRYFYSRPNGSFPGRNFMQGLPYMIGDKDPKDPRNGWDKSWAYLEELGKTIDYYPSGTAAMIREFAEGSRDIVPSTVGWDFNPRALGVVPKEAKITTFKNFRWITDADYMAVPRGIDQTNLAVCLHFLNYMLTPTAQAFVYDTGYSYPGPSIKNVPLSLAPAKTQALFKEFSRPELDELIDKVPKESQLPPDLMHYMLDRWDKQIGSKVGR